MKKIIIVLLGILLWAGCSTRKQVVVQESSVPQVVSQEQEVVAPAEQALPPTSLDTTSSKESTPKPEKSSTASSSDAQPKQPARAVFTPAPDQPAFKDEPLLDLTDRDLSPLTALAPRSDQEVPAPWRAEQLKYGLYYSFVKVGTAYIKNRGLVDINGRPAYVIQTTAFSASVIDAVFKVRDINFSWLDAQGLYSVGYGQSLREGNYRRDEWISFDYATNTYQGELQKKSAPRSLAGSVTGHVLDILSSLYYVRGQKTLLSGNDITFNIINREEEYPLLVKTIGRETVKTPAGRFKCVIVEPQFRGEGIFVSKGKSLKVWLTDDERKMPVKMKAEVFIGSVSAELLEYTPN